MVQDPYKVLGVERGASQDDIKRAYRRKAKECHPDLHPNDPDATRKMNEVNEAYDMLMNPEKYAQRREQEQARQQAHSAYQQYYGGSSSSQQGPYGGYQQYGPFGGFDFGDMFGFGGASQSQRERPLHQAGDSDSIRRAVDAINAAQFQQASIFLNGIVSTQRNARWYYLSALCAEGNGSMVQAMDFARRAQQMDPNNLTYRRLAQRFEQSGQSYQHRGAGWGMHTGSMQQMCMTFCMANLLCNCCCGGRGMYLCC